MRRIRLPAGWLSPRTATAPVPASRPAEPPRATVPGSRLAAPVPAVPAFVSEPTRSTSDDWPETETMVRTDAPFAPLRRARLEPDEAAPALAVPALIDDAPRDPASRVGLH